MFGEDAIQAFCDAILKRAIECSWFDYDAIVLPEVDGDAIDEFLAVVNAKSLHVGIMMNLELLVISFDARVRVTFGRSKINDRQPGCNVCE